MGAQHLLDLERRDLVAPRLDDVHAAAPEHAVGAVLDHGDVPGAEPAVVERRGRRVGLSPVFEEDPGSPDLDLAGRARGSESTGVVHQPHLHAGERRAHESGPPLAARRDHTETASNCGSISQRAPLHNAHVSTFTMPWTWCSGSTSKMWSSERHSQAATRLVT